jgi:hypothetical protein
MTNALPPHSFMPAKQYLESLTRETIQQAYHETDSGAFSKQGDREAAEVLVRHARLSRIQVELTGSMLGAHRCAIGLVNHRSPRGRLSEAPASPAFFGDAEAVAETVLPLLAPELHERAVSALERLAGAAEQMARCAWAEFKHRQGGEGNPLSPSAGVTAGEPS